MAQDKENASTTRALAKLLRGPDIAAPACRRDSFHLSEQVPQLRGLLVGPRLYQINADARPFEGKHDEPTKELHGCIVGNEANRLDLNDVLLRLDNCISDPGLPIHAHPAP